MTPDVVSPDQILLTGGSGRLGTELRALLPGINAPPRAELDVLDLSSIEEAVDRYRPAVLVHAAAYTDVAAAERDPGRCWKVNVQGTRHITRAIDGRGVVLVLISTDYVFAGTQGMYKEDDVPGPVRNYYALTKLVAEELCRLASRHLIIRTSFRGRDWPHPVAFVDLYTSQDYVDIVAPQIALAVRSCYRIPFDTLHIATKRKTAFDLARRRKPEVQAGNKIEAAAFLPSDVSLDVSRWQQLREQLAGVVEPTV